MRRYLVVFAALSLALSACEHAKEQDFQPYLKNQGQAIPNAYGSEAWAYPEGTQTADVIQRWKEADLVTMVTNGGRVHIWSPPVNVLTVYVGPNFYNLSGSSQRGLADAIAQIYGVGTDGRADNYMLMDSKTGKGIGNYTTAHGLQTY